MVALMTGQPALGKIGQQDWCAGGASIDQILLARSPLLGGPASPAQHDVRIAAARRRHPRRPRRGRAARAVVSGSAAEPDGHHAGAPAALSRDAAARGVQPPVRRRAAARDDARRHRPAAGAEAERARFHARRSGAPADADPGEREGSPRPRTPTPSRSWRRRSARACRSGRRRRVHCAGRAADVHAGRSAARAQSDRSTRTLAGLDYYTPNEPNNHPHQAVGRLHLALIKAAFACDLTRVATFSWASGTSWVLFPGTVRRRRPLPNDLASAPHHRLADSSDAATSAPGSRRSTPSTRAQTAQALQEFDAQARHRRQQPARQHRRRVRQRGLANAWPRPDQHAVPGVRRQEHAHPGRQVPQGDGRPAARARRTARRPATAPPTTSGWRWRRSSAWSWTAWARRISSRDRWPGWSGEGKSDEPAHARERAVMGAQREKAGSALLPASSRACLNVTGCRAIQ